ncbi:SOS response-associated peptidase family protein [Amycolatopsis sp.]|uniref:SOS response-associated peptidase family protein n=1 Tax=Amycolatopsis sp. TaxID=37632 RepID=UPI0039C8A290
MEKPAFKAAATRRRCLVPADGYYEWERHDGKKIPILPAPRRHPRLRQPLRTAPRPRLARGRPGPAAVDLHHLHHHRGP